MSAAAVAVAAAAAGRQSSGVSLSGPFISAIILIRRGSLPFFFSAPFFMDLFASLPSSPTRRLSLESDLPTPI